MNILVYLGLSDIGVKAGYLYGENNGYRIVTFSFLLIRVSFLSPLAAQVLSTAIRGVSRDPDWLIENAPSVRRARRKASAKAYARCEREYSDRIAILREHVERCGAENIELRSEVTTLRNAIKIVSQVEVTHE